MTWCSTSPPATTGSERAETEVRHEQTRDEPVSIVGLDARDGLARVAGNRKLYLKLLRQFVEQQGAVVEQITAALARGDRSLAERLAHTLKGVAGSIGARPVQSAAGALEKRIRGQADGAAMESAKQQLTAALEPLLAQLQATVCPVAPEDPLPSPPSAESDPARTREAAAQLTRLLAEFDPDAAGFIEANHMALRPLFAGEGWTQFGKLVEGYSFAEAQAQLEQALGQFPAAGRSRGK